MSTAETLAKEEKFVHLHLHTQFSALDGAIKIKELIPRLKELGMSSCAITDHGCMFGIIDFYKSCKSAGIHPIIGSEFYISPGNLTDRDYERGEISNYHLVLLAENNIGLKNLYKLSSIGFCEGFYRKPRIDKAALAKHSEGVIALSACLGGEIARKLIREDYKAALEAAIEYDRIMGRGNYFLEIQENGIPDQEIVNRQLISISKETGIPLVATCDCHYLRRENHITHNILMQIQYLQGNADKEPKSQPKKQINSAPMLTDDIDEDTSSQNESNKKGEYSAQLYVKSPEEIMNDFSYAPDAIENTVKIAKRCNVEIKFGDLHLPQYDVPEGYTIATYFSDLARKGLEERLKRVPEEKHQVYKDRLEEEIEVITMKGFDGYFLIVWDFINYSRRNKIPVGPGRGSGAGSLAAYALEITDIDPIRFNLLFERFLNPERVSMPDFDIDFCPNGRENVIEYVRERYGSERVCQIVTFGTLKPRNAVRDASRVLKIPLADADKMAKAIPGGPAITSFKEALEADKSLMEAFNKCERGLEVFEQAKNIDGFIRNIGRHAAGVIIADKPVTEYAPLCRVKEEKDVLPQDVCQFEKGAAEKIGLIKFDFLGLKNLTIIDDAIKRVRDSVAPDFDINDIPLDDKEVFDLLQRGDTAGVFQLESDGMKSLLRKLRPTVFEDIIAANALYRPGPINSGMLDDFVKRKHGEEKVKYDFPELEEILKETYGVIVYQEQVMQIACTLGGYTLGSADILRRAMGKKDKEEMARQRVIFLEGNEKTKGENERLIPGVKTMGFDVEKAARVFDLMAEFAEYGFNKSHSAAYALIAYQTAYLKAKFPLHYMAALITGAIDETSAMVGYISECKKMGINLLPPDINKGWCDFRTEGENGIRFGLGAIKSAGTAVINAFIKEREENGPYKSIHDFAKRIDYKNLNQRAVEALVKAGAFDPLGKNRSRLLLIYEDCLKEGRKTAKLQDKGFLTLDFVSDDDDDDREQPDTNEIPEKELLKMEKEVLGFYYSSHPLKEISGLTEKIGTGIDKIKKMQGLNTPVTAMGMIKELRSRITTTTHEKMANILLEDLNDEIEVVIFPRLYNKVAPLLAEDRVVVVRGEFKRDVEENGERLSIIAKEVIDLGEAIKRFTAGISMRFDVSQSSPENMLQLFGVLAKHKGDLPVLVTFEKPMQFRMVLKMPNNYMITPSADFISDVKGIRGFKEVCAVPFGEPQFLSEEETPDDFDDLQETA